MIIGATTTTTSYFLELLRLPLLDKLKLEWVWLGIDAPAVAWLAAIFVVECLAFALLRLCWVYLAEKHDLARVTHLLKSLADKSGRRPGQGASLEVLDSVRKVMEESGVPPLSAAWYRFEATLIARPGESSPSYLAEEESAKTFSVSSLLAERLNIDFYRALPGILTGIGLCATFVALLVALLDVRLQGTRVQGLDLLIQGLSGKFLSSIAALLAATVLIVAEKKIFHWLDNRVSAVAEQIDRIFPRLTASQVLMLMHREMSEQTLAFKHFNGDLATVLKNGVSEGVSPTMGRMVDAIESMNGLLRTAESNKNDSIATQVKGVLTDLQNSLQQTLGQMGDKFTSALSGSTMTQFEQLSQNLAGAGRLIESMGEQFQTTQTSLQEVVRLARSSTEQQMAFGRTQVEELTTVLRELMRQMNDSASTSIGQMTGTLTAIVHELSTKVTDLSSTLAFTVTDASGKATNAASEVVTQVSRWSEKNERQLSDLLERHGKQLDQISELRIALDQSAARFSNTVNDSARLFDDLKALSGNTARTISAVEAASRGMTDVQSGFREAAKSVAVQVEHLDSVNRSHKEAWAGMQSTLAAYQDAFQKTQRASGELLQQVNSGAGQFSNITKTHFESLMTVSNEILSDAVQKMAAMVGELNETLDELSDVFSHARAPNPPPTSPSSPPRLPVRA